MYRDCSDPPMAAHAQIGVIVLAAGKGTRMQSTCPKVLQPLGGRPLLRHVLRAVETLQADHQVVVTGYASDQVRAACAEQPRITWAYQQAPLGTADAVAAAYAACPALAHGRVVVVYGDVPLIPPQLLSTLITDVPPHALGVVTAICPDPTGFGRMVRDPDTGAVVRIVEQADATIEEQQITEINTGIYVIPGDFLAQILPQLPIHPEKGEYYLTDVLPLAIAHGISVVPIRYADHALVLGANNRTELARLEQIYQQRAREALMEQGVWFQDPTRVFIRGDVQVGPEVCIDVDVILEGSVQLGAHVRIGPFSYLRDVHIADGVQIHSHTHLENTQIGPHSQIGPFTRLRAGVHIGAQCRIGNFVEIKKSTVGDQTRVAHLSYMGDAQVGAQVNWGAGAITCNYDGQHKHPTVVGDGCFIGSQAALVAPVTVADHAFVAAGSVITRDVPPYALAVARVPQKHIAHWVMRRFRSNKGE